MGLWATQLFNFFRYIYICVCVCVCNLYLIIMNFYMGKLVILKMSMQGFQWTPIRGWIWMLKEYFYPTKYRAPMGSLLYQMAYRLGESKEESFGSNKEKCEIPKWNCRYWFVVPNIRQLWVNSAFRCRLRKLQNRYEIYFRNLSISWK